MARDPKYDVLFEPVKIGPKVARNRFFAVPHCNQAGSDKPGVQAAFRGMKAEGGWSVVCTEYCSIGPESDDFPHTSARLWDDGDVINLRHMTDVVHSHDALAGVQLWFGGGFAQGLESGEPQRGPSEYPNENNPQNYSHACTVAEIKEILKLYAEAAKRAEQAGFDLIDLIASDSHLPVQFLSPHFNHRTDEYGGSFENRARFWLECLEALREATGGRLVIDSRIAIDELRGPDGIELEDGLRFVELAEREGLCDAWLVKVSTYNGWGNDSGPSRFFKSHNQGWATKPVKEIAKGPVVQVGRLTSPDDMVQVIEEGEADFIGGARPSIADPYLPKKIEEGRPGDIRECIGCNVCVSRFWIGSNLACTQNATAMEEYRRGWHPEIFTEAVSPCSVLVVGAGPAGMECARVLGLRGYDVHLREAEAEIGGCVRDIMRYPGLAEWGRVITYRESQLEKLKNVEVHTGVGAMSADDVLNYGAEKVVIATGASWREDGLSGVSLAAIPGADASKPQLSTPEQIMAGKEVGDRVVVLDADGYFTGIGMAELMADAGKQVTMIVPQAQASYYTVYTLEGDNVQHMLHEKKIAVMPFHWAEAIEAGNVTTVRAFNLYREGYRIEMPTPAGRSPRKASDEVTEVECDNVILVTARRSNRALLDALEARESEWRANGIEGVYPVGDCYAPRILQLAIFDGHRLAREFDEPDARTPKPFIRERPIWGQEAMPRL
ncbi:MAG: FAD-dependent oxidoreductase [Proteobacteria bacterium]|nr:FAD-dependent oxidoreductase [Pseudomonadota bacterium]